MAIKPRHIALYADDGAGPFGLYSLKAYFPAQYHVTPVYALDVINNTAFDKCDLFIMPGGADRPYCSKLNGTGNANIRRYIEKGGVYLGVCAGAYYGARDIEFHKGSADEICEKRELSLIQTTARGSLSDICLYTGDTLNTAKWTSLKTKEGIIHHGYYHGGCAFSEEDDSITVLARYEKVTSKPAAIITKKIGNGHVILSGIHPETTAQSLKEYYKENPPEPDEAHTLSPLIDIGKNNPHPAIGDYLLNYIDAILAK